MAYGREISTCLQSSKEYGTLYLLSYLPHCDTKMYLSVTFTIFGRRFVKRFALCYRTAVGLVCLACPVLSVCDVGALYIVAKRLDDQDETWHAARPQPRLYCVRWRVVVSRPWSWSQGASRTWKMVWSWSWNKSLGLGLGLDEKVSTFSRPWWMII